MCANTSHCFPTDPGAFARFARAAVERYGPTSPIPELHNSVRVWQIWNEANHYPFVQPTVDVAGYSVMLQQTYAAIKPVDPNSVVLAGATSPAGDDPNGQTRCFRVDVGNVSATELPLREPRLGASVVAAPNGTLAILGGTLVSGGPALSIESYFPE